MRKSYPAPKKSLGQNFLRDPRIIDRMITACGLTPQDHVVEIGPGHGALTYRIAQHVQTLTVIEKDTILAAALKKQTEHPNIHVIHADVLEVPFETLGNNLKIIGNLPYNIAAPIIEKVIRHRQQWNCFFATIQLEHALRMAGKPHTKEYGSLSCFIQYYTEIKKLFTIKNTCFYPKPKVQSAFIELRPKDTSVFQIKNEDLLFSIIQQAFRHRRKTIQNTLSGLISKIDLLDILEEGGIDPKWRAEDLYLKHYIKILKLAEARSLDLNLPNL